MGDIYDTLAAAVKWNAEDDPAPAEPEMVTSVTVTLTINGKRFEGYPAGRINIHPDPEPDDDA